MSNSKNAHACRRERKLNVNMANTARDGVRNRLITKYFFDGYPYRTILLLLGLHHGLRLSLRQLQRILTKLGLRRKIKPTRSHFRLVQALIHVSYVVRNESLTIYDLNCIMLSTVAIHIYCTYIM